MDASNAASNSSNPPTVPHGIPSLEQATPAPMHEETEIIIVTGMSGAGRSRAAAVLEDQDWYVVDNLPPRMLMHLAGMVTHTGSPIRRLAAVVDVRSREFFADLVEVLTDFKAQNLNYRILFLDASDEVLVRRFEQVRRPHPLQNHGRVLDGIQAERELLTDLSRRADVSIDTSELSVHDLARRVRELVVAVTDQGVQITLVSFGFKYGLPLDADHVVDVRFLSNPYWVTELRHLTGKDEPVRDFVLSLEGAQEFVDRYVEMVNPLIPSYANEQKYYLTIAVGCTGGKHRSVALSEAIAAKLRGKGQVVRTLHRDLGRE